MLTLFLKDHGERDPLLAQTTVDPSDSEQASPQSTPLMTQPIPGTPGTSPQVTGGIRPPWHPWTPTTFEMEVVGALGYISSSRQVRAGLGQIPNAAQLVWPRSMRSLSPQRRLASHRAQSPAELAQGPRAAALAAFLYRKTWCVDVNL